MKIHRTALRTWAAAALAAAAALGDAHVSPGWTASVSPATEAADWTPSFCADLISGGRPYAVVVPDDDPDLPDPDEPEPPTDMNVGVTLVRRVVLARVLPYDDWQQENESFYRVHHIWHVPYPAERAWFLISVTEGLRYEGPWGKTFSFGERFIPVWFIPVRAVRLTGPVPYGIEARSQAILDALDGEASQTWDRHLRTQPWWAKARGDYTLTLQPQDDAKPPKLTATHVSDVLARLRHPAAHSLTPGAPEPPEDAASPRRVIHDPTPVVTPWQAILSAGLDQQQPWRSHVDDGPWKNQPCGVPRVQVRVSGWGEDGWAEPGRPRGR